MSMKTVAFQVGSLEFFIPAEIAKSAIALLGFQQKPKDGFL